MNFASVEVPYCQHKIPRGAHVRAGNVVTGFACHVHQTPDGNLASKMTVTVIGAAPYIARHK